MAKYADFWVKMPKRFQTALKKCRTDQFLARSGGIADEFHKSVREYDGSSDDQFREAYVRATETMAPLRRVPFGPLKRTAGVSRDPGEFFQHHLGCLRPLGLRKGRSGAGGEARHAVFLQVPGA